MIVTWRASKQSLTKLFDARASTTFGAMEWIEKYTSEKDDLPTNPSQLRNFAIHRGGILSFTDARNALQRAKSMTPEKFAPAASERTRARLKTEPARLPPSGGLPSTASPSDGDAKASSQGGYPSKASAAVPQAPPAGQERLVETAAKEAPTCQPPLVRTISQKKAAEALLHINHSTLMNVVEIFAACDIDDNGFVTKDELLQACSPESDKGRMLRRSLQISEGAQAVLAAFEEMDENSDSKVTFEELYEYVARVCEKPGGVAASPPHTERDSVAAFTHFSSGRKIYDECDPEDSETEDMDAAPTLIRSAYITRGH